jgi:hypothetical protein
MRRLFEYLNLRERERERERGSYRKLKRTYYRVFHNSFSSSKIIVGDEIKEDEMARMGGIRSTYKMLVGKPERKIKFGRPRHRRDDNIKMDLKET